MTDAMKICPWFNLDDPRKAGSMTMEALCSTARQYMHLIPCGARDWSWVYRETCKNCEAGQYIPPRKRQ